jgi:hypothetical protein
MVNRKIGKTVKMDKIEKSPWAFFNQSGLSNQCTTRGYYAGKKNGSDHIDNRESRENQDNQENQDNRENRENRANRENQEIEKNPALKRFVIPM